MSGLASPNNRLMQQGVVAKNPPDLILVNRAPVSSDFDFNVGTIWIYINTAAYMMVSKIANVANWKIITLSQTPMDSFQPDSGTNPVVPDAQGLVRMAGSGSITTVGSLNTLTTQLTGLTEHSVLVGSGTTTITKVGPSATSGQVLQSAGLSADPAFSTATYPATTTINQVLYSSANNTVSGITSGIDGVLVSGHTGVPSWLSNGMAGQVLTANTNLPPSWQTNSGGDVVGPASSTDRAIATWNGATGKVLFDNSGTNISSNGNITTTTSVAAQSIQITASNTDNTNNASHSNLILNVGGTSGGDPYVTVASGSARSYGFGIDNATSGQPLCIGTAANSNSRPGVGTVWRMSSSGVQNLPSQPAFAAYLGTTAANVTGNGTYYALGDTDVGVALTEVFDAHSDFTTGSATGAFFTAPVTGHYQFNVALFMQQVTLATDMDFLLDSSNLDWRAFNVSPTAVANGSSFGFNMSAFIDMDVGDTCGVLISLNGIGADTADVYGAASDPRSYFAGFLQG